MANPQDPANTGTGAQAGGAPRVHHPHPGTTHPQAQPGAAPGVTPQDLNNPFVFPYLRGQMPQRIVIVGGAPRPAPPDTPPTTQTVLTLDQFVESLQGRVAVFRDNPDDVPDMLKEMIGTAFLLDGINTQAVRIDLPYNADQVLAGGYAVLRACAEQVEEIETLKVDAAALGQDLALAERIRSLLVVIEEAYKVLDANHTIVLNSIAKRVDDGLKRAGSVIDANGELGRMLENAKAIKGDPSDQALSTRAENARLKQAGRDEGQQLALQQQGDAGKTPPATTVVLQQGPPVAGTPDAKTTPAQTVAPRTGHRKP